MSSEQARLVGSRGGSESSTRNSFGSLREMAYTEDRLAGARDNATDPDGAGDASHAAHANSDNNSLLDVDAAPDQLHEDALAQAGCGLAQLRVIVASFLAVMGASLELSAIPFILPSAEIELCILKNEKNWLVLISLVGCSIGSANWGLVADRLGRKRCMLSCLAVNAIFAAVAAFMPTYGTFMMARFCSALGSSGAVVAGFCWVREVARYWRRLLPLLVLAGAGGAAAAAALAEVSLPPTGALALPQQPARFTAWHRYLLICTLPILASLISLIWTQESPRYLLEVGREVDAMMVYQNIHSSNQIVICGGRRGRASEDKYRLGELALPEKRGTRKQISYTTATLQLFSSAYRMKTISLGGVLIFCMAIQFYLSSYIPATVERIENEIFEASRLNLQNMTFENELYNKTLENVIYTNVTFTNCTFRDILLSHVAFNNCTFNDVAFSNIKTSYTEIKSGMFFNSTIIDTDMELGREIDEYSVLNSTIIRGMSGACSSHVDLTSRLWGLVTENWGVGGFGALAALWAVAHSKIRPTLPICVLMILLSPSLYLCESEMMLYGVEWAYRVLTTVAIFNATVGLMEFYPAHIRCTGHGMLLSVAFGGAAIVRGIPPALPAAAATVTAILAAAAATFAAAVK